MEGDEARAKKSCLYRQYILLMHHKSVSDHPVNMLNRKGGPRKFPIFFPRAEQVWTEKFHGSLF